jgi:hypothetical protein
MAITTNELKIEPAIDANLAKALRTQETINQPYISSKSQLQSGITEAQGREAQAKQRQERILAEGAKTGLERETQVITGAQQTYQKEIEAEPLPAFIPTKDSATDIAGLFSLISVIGAVVGKKNAQMAMGNMNAMLEGHQKGRADLYKKERNEFDTNFKAMIKKHEEFRKKMEDAIKLAPRDKEKAMADAKIAAVEAGSDIVKAQLDRGFLTDAYKTVDELQKGITKVKEAYEKETAAERRHSESLASSRENARLAREQALNLAQAKAGVGGALPKDTKTRDEHRFRDNAIENVRDILNDLENPELRKLIGPENQYVPDVLLNLQDKYPALAQKLARFQAQEFQIGGKALTLSEQKILNPIYGWRNLTAKALEDNLNEADRQMSREQRKLEKIYPGLVATRGEAPSAAPTASSDVDVERSNAKAVIAAGAPEDRVRERFKQRTGQEL